MDDFLALELSPTYLFYVFVNVAMVIGMISVVGVPLPLISYSRTAMLTAMFGFGLLMSVSLDHDVRLNRAGEPQPDWAGQFGFILVAPSINAT